jgi:hypothetical protein
LSQMPDLGLPTIVGKGGLFRVTGGGRLGRMGMA